MECRTEPYPVLQTKGLLLAWTKNRFDHKRKYATGGVKSDCLSLFENLTAESNLVARNPRLAACDIAAC